MTFSTAAARIKRLFTRTKKQQTKFDVIDAAIKQLIEDNKNAPVFPKIISPEDWYDAKVAKATTMTPTKRTKKVINPKRTSPTYSTKVVKRETKKAKCS